MKATVAIALYAVAVVVLSAAAAPWVFWAVQFTNTHWWHSAWLARQPFRRVLDRTLLVVALAGLWPLLRALDLRSWAQLGFPRVPAWRQQLGSGLLVGIGSLAVAAVLGMVVNGETLGASRPAGRLLGYVGTAAVVALVEEVLFRGGLQGALQRCMDRRVGLVVASAVYAVAHFIKPSQVNVPAESVEWSSGFAYLVLAMSGFARTPETWVALVTLFLAGVILGWAFLRTQALYWSVGLHAGWVFTIKTYSWMGGGNLLQHVVVWPVLIGVFFVVRTLCRKY